MPKSLTEEQLPPRIAFSASMKSKCCESGANASTKNQVRMGRTAANLLRFGNQCHLLIVNPLAAEVYNRYSTHPPTQERIRRLLELAINLLQQFA